MILEELATLLQSAGLGPIIRHALPAQGPSVEGAPPQIALVEMAGRGPVRSLESPPSRYERPVVVVLTRSAPYGYAAARQKAQDAWEVLDGISNQTLSGTRYLWIQALNSVHWIRDDDLARSILSFDVECARAL